MLVDYKEIEPNKSLREFKLIKKAKQKRTINEQLKEGKLYGMEPIWYN